MILLYIRGQHWNRCSYEIIRFSARKIWAWVFKCGGILFACCSYDRFYLCMCNADIPTVISLSPRLRNCSNREHRAQYCDIDGWQWWFAAEYAASQTNSTSIQTADFARQRTIQIILDTLIRFGSLVLFAWALSSKIITTIPYNNW